MQYGGDTTCDQYVCSRYVLELEPMDLTATSSISNRVWNKFIEHTIVEYYLVNSFSGSPGGRHMVLSWLCQQVFYILLASLSDLTTLVYPRSLEHHIPVMGLPPPAAPVDRTNRQPLNATQVKLTVECFLLAYSCSRPLNAFWTVPCTRSPSESTCNWTPHSFLNRGSDWLCTPYTHST